jgi:hypothetical protein
MIATLAKPTSFPSDLPVSGCRHSYLIRSLCTSDEPALVGMFSRSSAEDTRLRCLGAINDFPHLGAARLMRSDTDREIALVAVDPTGPPQGDILGVVHLINEPGKSDGVDGARAASGSIKGRAKMVVVRATV